MTKKQLAALQRILNREAAAYRALSGRPAPGQHPSQDKYAISDGNICILSDAPFPDLRMGERVDSLARIVQNERKGEAHSPVPQSQIDQSSWARQIGQSSGQPHEVELSAHVLRPDQLNFYDVGTAETPTEIVGRFDPQLLVDAVDAVGGKPQLFLGMGRFNSRFPSLLVFPPNWREYDGACPIVLVLPFR